MYRIWVSSIDNHFIDRYRRQIQIRSTLKKSKSQNRTEIQNQHEDLNQGQSQIRPTGSDLNKVLRTFSTRRHIPRIYVSTRNISSGKGAVGTRFGKSDVRCTESKKSRKIWKSSCNSHAVCDRLQEQVQSCRRTLKFKFVSLQRTNLKFTYKYLSQISDKDTRKLNKVYTSKNEISRFHRERNVWNSKTHPVIRHSPYSEDYLNLRWNKLNFKVRAKQVEEKSYLQTRRVLGRSSWLFEEHQWRSRLVAVAVKAVAVKIPFGCSSRFVESVKKPWIAKELSDSY